MTFYVSSVTFNPDGIEITFMEMPGDVRGEGGCLVRTRAYAVREFGPYGDEVAAIREAVTDLVEELDEDWATTPVFEPDLDDAGDADEDAGMGSG